MTTPITRGALTSGRARRAMESPRSAASIRQTCRLTYRRQAYLRMPVPRWNPVRLNPTKTARSIHASQALSRKSRRHISYQTLVSPQIKLGMSPCPSTVYPASRVCSERIATTTSATNQATKCTKCEGVTSWEVEKTFISGPTVRIPK